MRPVTAADLLRRQRIARHEIGSLSADRLERWLIDSGFATNGDGRPAQGPRAGQLVHDYLIRNPGPGVITELVLWIEDGDREDISSGTRLTDLAVGAEEVAAVGVMQENRQGQRPMVRWTDADDTYGPMWTGTEPPLDL